MSALLIAGTTSDAGKSLVTAALCRALARRGVSVAPFKAQNMSNNSMVVGADPAGEIGRAQWVQALAAGVEPEVAMNPVLLKPGADQHSHVIVNGQPAGTISSSEFIGGRTHLAATAFAAFDDLRSRFDVVVCEGAGSPAEINLRSGDYTNMGLAQHGGMPVIVVGDIDRGGVFASLFGTVALLAAADQRLIAGFVINKFRGNDALLQPGIDRLTALTGRPTLGVLPWSPDVWLDSEDALDVASQPGGTSPSRGTSSSATLRVGVVRLPRISNFTDVDALALEPDVDLRWVSDARGIADVDLVVLPGTRATISDLGWLRWRGIDRAMLEHSAAGRAVLGICGGFQMLGRSISDPDGAEGDAGAEVAGLGLLDVATVFGANKVLRRHPDGSYEIHHGRIRTEAWDDGWVRAGAVWGTMKHGSLESDTTRAAVLEHAAAAVGQSWQPSEVSFAAAREGRLDVLGDLVDKHLDIDALLALARDGAPQVPLLPPGASE
jgi:adenosylcobyric acid synthase